MTATHNSFHPDEWALRVELAALYRLVALYGWTDLIFTHISAKLPESVSGAGKTHFLINPYGMLFDEITASSLIKVDEHCNKLSDSPHPVNPAGFVIHSAIHLGREDAKCVLHTHTRAGVAVSAQAGGVLPISQQASIVLRSLSYHDYEGIAVFPDEKPRLVNNLGGNQFFVLRNHGLLTVAPSIPDAFLQMYILETTCQIQLAAQAGGELIMVEQPVLDRVNQALEMQKGVNGAFAWPALLRKLARAGHNDFAV